MSIYSFPTVEEEAILCLIDDADGIDWTLLSESRQTARKLHRCDECGRTILPGERYERATGINDGVMETTKACAHCIQARLWLIGHCGGWCFGGLFQDLQDHADDAGEDSIVASLTEGAACGWREWTPLDVRFLVEADCFGSPFGSRVMP